jgi:hypothetical protein
MADRMNTMRIQQANMAVQQNTAEALAALVTDEIPESMIENEINARIRISSSVCSSRGWTSGPTSRRSARRRRRWLRSSVSPPSRPSRSTSPFGRSPISKGWCPDDDRIDEVIAEMAGPSGQDPDELKARLAEVGQISALRADLAKQAAMEWLTDNVELVDEDGEAIDREALEFPARGAEEDSEEEE